MDRDQESYGTPASEEAVWERVLRMRDDAAALAAAGGLGFLSDEAVDGVLLAAEEVARLVPVLQQQLVVQVADRGLDTARGYASTASYLRDVLHLRYGEAAGRVRYAGLLQPRTAVSGEALPPVYPSLAAAQADGAVSPAHVAVIADRLEKLPHAVTDQDRAEAERALADHARVFDPTALGKLATKVAACLDPDDTLAGEEEKTQKRELTFGRDLHGMVRPGGALDPEAMGWIHAALDPLAKPVPEVDGAKDPRSAARRYADALVELCKRQCAHPDMPTQGGAKPTLVVTIALHDLEQRAGLGRLPYSDPVTARAALRMACDATLIPAVLDHDGQPLSVGRSQRVIGPALRRALEIRDKGCAWPGCDTPPTRCEGHHIQPWALGGPTDLANTALLCTRHHDHADTGDWTLELNNGRIQVTPPPWVDPKQKPRVNHLHDPP
ncbi:MAG: DUF222 domain-containing protein [Streptosporangiales bacterium]